MAFPTIPTAGASTILTSSQATATTTHTFPNLSNLPHTPGALLLAIIVCYQGGSANAEFSAWGGGFLEFVDQSANSTTIQSIGAAYKLNATGSESGTFTVTTVASTRSVMFLMEIEGAHASTLPEATAKANGTTAAADPAALDPANWAAEDTLWIAVGVNGEISLTGTFTGITAAPANYTDYLDSGIVGGDVIGALEGAVAFRQLNASSENVGTFTLDVAAAGNSALLIAVRPAPAPVTGTALGAVTAAGAALGEVGHTGTALGSVTTDGTVAGIVDRTGTAVGVVSSTGTAAGERGVVGAAVGDVTATGHASGSPGGPPPVEGTALGAVTATGTATGERGVTGTASSNVTGTGTAAGVVDHLGVALGAVVTTGTAVGIRDVQGQAVSAVTADGVVAGTREVAGAAVGAVVATGTVIGLVGGQVQGTALGAVTATGHAAGVVGAASGVTLRPSSGTTPAVLGTTTRPSTGDSARPLVGATLRPDSGTTP